jgi:hypothetical protein
VSVQVAIDGLADCDEAAWAFRSDGAQDPGMMLACRASVSRIRKPT